MSGYLSEELYTGLFYSLEQSLQSLKKSIIERLDLSDGFPNVPPLGQEHFHELETTFNTIKTNFEKIKEDLCIPDIVKKLRYGSIANPSYHSTSTTFLTLRNKRQIFPYKRSTNKQVSDVQRYR